MSDKAVITCALNGVLTDPKQHNVPVTPEQMAREAKAAFDAGASVMHIHLRSRRRERGICRPGKSVSARKSSRRSARPARA
jgi:uncharacterized protein (DUF849 family)